VRLNLAPFLIFLNCCLSLPSLGHQSYREVQREKIHSRLIAAGCGDMLLAHTDSPAVREVSRSGASRSRSLNRALEDNRAAEDFDRYSDFFSLLIREEFNVAYGYEGDPLMHEVFRRDKTEGAAKIAVQKELGITWPDDGAPTSVPTWLALAQNIRSGEPTFDAALIYYRKTGTVERNGKVEDVYENCSIAPARGDAFPDARDGWKLMTKDTELNGVKFNIPFDVVFLAMKDGKFPMLDAIHDISHFVAFQRFPEFAKVVHEQMGKLDLAQVKDAPGFKSREYWLTEALSLPDPDGEKANHALLAQYRRPTRHARAIGQIEIELEKMRASKEAQFIEYALESGRHLESQLRDVSGGNSSGGEKWFYLSETFGLRAQALLDEDIHSEGMSDHGRAQYGSPIGAAMQIAQTYFDGGPVTLKANKKRLSNETATFTFNTLVTAQEILALSLQQNQLNGVSRVNALEALLKFTARTEYLLVNKPFTYRQWATSFLQIDLGKKDPLYQMLTTVFPNEIIAKYYLGVGEKRPVKPKVSTEARTRGISLREGGERSRVEEILYVEDGADDE
jgi:hypothetical protein